MTNEEFEEYMDQFLGKEERSQPPPIEDQRKTKKQRVKYTFEQPGWMFLIVRTKGR